METPDGQRWWFDSGSLALDFAYTGGPDVLAASRDGGRRADWADGEGRGQPERLADQRFPEVAPTAGEREFRDASDARARRSAGSHRRRAGRRRSRPATWMW